MELQQNTNYFNVSDVHRIDKGNAPLLTSGLICKNVKISGRRTSIRLEPEMWEALEVIALREKCSASQICSLANTSKRPRDSVTAAIRIYILRYFMSASIGKDSLKS